MLHPGAARSSAACGAHCGFCRRQHGAAAPAARILGRSGQCNTVASLQMQQPSLQKNPVMLKLTSPRLAKRTRPSAITEIQSTSSAANPKPYFSA